MINRDINVSIALTPRELAREFLSYSALEQAHFFNELGAIEFGGVLSGGLYIEYASRTAALTDKGRAVMKRIGEYAEDKG